MYVILLSHLCSMLLSKCSYHHPSSFAGMLQRIQEVEGSSPMRVVKDIPSSTAGASASAATASTTAAAAAAATAAKAKAEQEAKAKAEQDAKVLAEKNASKKIGTKMKRGRGY